MHKISTGIKTSQWNITNTSSSHVIKLREYIQIIINPNIRYISTTDKILYIT